MIGARFVGEFVILFSVVNRGGVWGLSPNTKLPHRAVSGATPDPGRVLVVYDLRAWFVLLGRVDLFVTLETPSRGEGRAWPCGLIDAIVLI